MTNWFSPLFAAGSARVRLFAHLGREAARSPVVRQVFQEYERPNLHLAIEAVLAKSQAPSPIGLVERQTSATLSQIVHSTFGTSFPIGPVEYVDVSLGDGERIACVKRGLYLTADDAGRPIALLIASDGDSYPPKILVEVMANERAVAEQFLRRVTEAVQHGKAYRGRVFSLERNCYGEVEVKFHRLPAISREQIILPNELLERIERHSISFSRHAERLQKCGRHLKRGLLLHGPPGTGKTLCATYLATRLENRTVILLTGGGMGSIEAACHLARLLAPTTVILEDVDLIGAERENQTVGANALLFELLNQMDGLNEDCDVLFILTTNRPDVLEPALSARPGRIDQAIEIPLPGEPCRSRLIELYAEGLTLAIDDRSDFVRRLEGASAAFIKELLRKAAVLSAEEHDGPDIVVDYGCLDRALSELLVAGGSLTRTLLGAKISPKEPAAN
ncbi:AAA family ATPase [Botrimarina mediterranea]|uniref:ATP-dependent zinc metalloprotease FtsH 3 n=1 Tax=Botrimarina mediterranea TaxID=2528022 RepID=A0A518K7T3_9BACT|nr:AAA family ATPase [Botrimarina mediterranea]QDV73837.1 ATP-dependent zinc metalloprotease FtsH 3 [Botrimarina mediterranea]QDV78467.1 ATP-dependent zinc metalloprotease FtsH 3 [Planctomycetes bacterium K2D]